MLHKTSKISLSSIHHFLRYHYGKPTYCENKKCDGKSKIYEWCKKTGREYTRNPKDYKWLCRSCHRKYDLTPEKKKAAISNLWWKKGKENPGKDNQIKPGQVLNPKGISKYKQE